MAIKVSKIFNIFLSAGYQSAENLSERINLNINSLRLYYPDAAYELYTDERLREFIIKNFDTDTITAYDSLLPLAYKTDLGRYCLLYEYGGLYSDLALHHFSNLTENEIQDKDLYGFRDAASSAPWITSNSLILSRINKHPIFEKCIIEIIKNCSEKFYGTTPLCITGPNVFGRLLAAYTPLSTMSFGNVVRVNQDRFHSLAFVTPAGRLAAVSDKKGGGLGSIGGKISEDYNKIYYARNVYGEMGAAQKYTPQEYLDYGFLRNCLQVSEKIFQTKGNGLPFLLGPNATLGAGCYIFNISIEIITVSSQDQAESIDFVIADGRTVNSIEKVKIAKLERPTKILLAFNTSSTARNLQLLAFSKAAVTFRFYGLRIERKGDAHQIAPAPVQSAQSQSN